MRRLLCCDCLSTISHVMARHSTAQHRIASHRIIWNTKNKQSKAARDNKAKETLTIGDVLKPDLPAAQHHRHFLVCSLDSSSRLPDLPDLPDPPDHPKRVITQRLSIIVAYLSVPPTKRPSCPNSSSFDRLGGSPRLTHRIHIGRSANLDRSSCRASVIVTT